MSKLNPQKLEAKAGAKGSSGRGKLGGAGETQL